MGRDGAAAATPAAVDSTDWRKQRAGLPPHTHENPRGARPLTPDSAPGAGGAPSWPRARCALQLLRLGWLLDFSPEGDRDWTLSRAFTKPESGNPTKQQTKSDPRASAFCCCPSSSPGITYLVTEEERWEPEAKPKRFPQRGVPPRFQLHFGVVGVGSIASPPARVWEAVGGVPPTSIPTREGYGRRVGVSGPPAPPLRVPAPCLSGTHCVAAFFQHAALRSLLSAEPRRFVRGQRGSARPLELRSIHWICGFHDVSLRGPSLFSQPRIFFSATLAFPPSFHRVCRPRPCPTHTPPPLLWPRAQPSSPLAARGSQFADGRTWPERLGGWRGGDPREPGSQTQSWMHRQENGVS